MKKYKVVFLQYAKFDLASAKKYYRDIDPSLAKRFLVRFHEAVMFISENPFAVDIVYKNVRMHLLKKFPYHIHYVVNSDEQTLVIIAVEFAIKDDINFSHRI